MRLIPAALAAAALSLLATACSAAAPGTSGSPGGASTAPTTTAAATASAAAPLTGTQLAARLEPASWFPAGTHGQGKTVSSGAAAQTPLPPIVSGGCVRLGGPDAVDLSKVGSLSFAWNLYADQGTGTTYAQQIDVYPGTSASRVMARLRQLATTCASFQEPGGDGTMTVHLEPGPKLGDDALILELSDAPVGEALEAVRVGTAVVTVLYIAPGGTGVSQATSLATALTARLAAK
jgi:hypothetical protein